MAGLDVGQLTAAASLILRTKDLSAKEPEQKAAPNPESELEKRTGIPGLQAFADAGGVVEVK